MEFHEWLIESKGGRLWEKGQYRRIYFNSGVLAEAMGLETGRYGTGHISSATRHGEHISNAEAGRILEYLNYGKFFYDLTTEKFSWAADSRARGYDEEVKTIFKGWRTEYANQ